METHVDTQLGSIDTEELMQLCAVLTSIPSPNPPGETSAIAEYIRELLVRAGGEATIYTPRPDVASLVCSVAGEAPAIGAPTLLLSGHLDTFPAVTTGWSHPPFPARRTATRIYGPGVTDMRAGLAAIITVAGLALERRHSLAGRVVLALAGDEETGSRWGTEWLLDNVESVRGDVCVVTDQNGIASVSTAEKGFVWCRIDATGVGGHGAYSSSSGAFRSLIPALSSILELETEPTWSEGSGCTVNVGQVGGGSGPNLAPASAYAYVDVRFPPGHSADAVTSRIREVLARASPDCKVEVIRSFDGLCSPEDHPLITRFVDCVRARVGPETPTVTRSGTSDARFFRRAGIPTVLYGPSPHNMGAADDYLETHELVTVTAALADFVGAVLTEAVVAGDEDDLRVDRVVI